MKHLFGASSAAAMIFIGPQAAAQPTTYVVSAAPYNSVANSTACPVGTCQAIYTTSQRVSGTITFANPLVSDLDANTDDLGLQVFGYEINDGQNLFSYDGPNDTINAVRVSTNSSGAITGFEFKFDKTNGAPYNTGAGGGAKARISSIYLSSVNNMAVANSNAICNTRGDFSAAAMPGAACQSENPDTAQGASSASAVSPVFALQPPPPAPVPSLSEWAMILLGGLLAGGAALNLSRRRTV